MRNVLAWMLLGAAIITTPNASSEPYESEAQKVLRVQRENEAENVPVRFYGQVQDQKAQPVPGATVEYTITAMPGLMTLLVEDSNKTHGKAVTDSAGRFAILKGKGRWITVDAISKAGYEFQPSNSLIYLSPKAAVRSLVYVSDPANPMPFRVWNGAETAALIHFEGHYLTIKSDGRVYSIDLATGKLEEGDTGTDLKVRCLADQAWRYDHPDHPDSDWRCDLEASGGGFILSTEDYMNEAPESGYQSPLVFSSSDANTPRHGRFVEAKYFVLARGHYSRIDLTLGPFMSGRNTGSSLKLVYWLNPDGSRNLHYDPSKRIRVPGDYN